MRLRRILSILSAVILLIIGSAAGYFAISIPNDLRAEALLKEARSSLENDQRDEARDSLVRIVHEFPRTDAAATASHTLFRMADQDRKRLQDEIRLLTGQRIVDQRRLVQLEQKIGALEKKQIETVQAPPAAKPVVKKAAPKKTTPKKTTPKKTTRRKK
ncbi:MAG TPA: hypothetical protein VMT00_15010 [Thermoanaerobaculia bacterium]|nr:hypothetical protein [Thermoanaerobaculia bacterium]